MEKKTTAKKGNQKKVKEVLLELVRYYDEDEKVFKEEDLPTGFQVSIDDVVCHMANGKMKYGNKPKKK